jgi:hypothetical protein
VPGALHTRIHRSALYDQLRIEVMRNGAIKSPTPQSERPILAELEGSLMTTDGIGQAWTTSRSSRTYQGGGITPQTYSQQAAGVNTDAGLSDAGVAMNARATLPNRGTGTSPMARRA